MRTSRRKAGERSSSEPEADRRWTIWTREDLDELDDEWEELEDEADDLDDDEAEQPADAEPSSVAHARPDPDRFPAAATATRDRRRS